MQIKDILLNLNQDQYTLPHFWVKDWLMICLNQSPNFLITHDTYTLSDLEYKQFIEGVRCMQSGVPLAYLLGKQAFFGYEFMVNEHTLIPRPDTEILVEKALTFIKESSLTQGRILDLGTGSGCIGISLAKSLANFELIACDNNQYALDIAKQNAQHIGVNCQFIHSHWYQHIQGKFDLIVSNPPYIAKDDPHLIHLQQEPITALVADDEGLSDIKHIINHAGEYLNNQGMLIIEHGYRQKQAVFALFEEACFEQIGHQKDYGGNDRITFGIYTKIVH